MVQLLRWFQATSDIAVNEKSSISDYNLMTIQSKSTSGLPDIPL